MPVKNYRKKLRQKWLDENGPCHFCGSADRLEVDHIDPSLKTTDRVWLLPKAKRLVELSNCRPLCHKCHKKRTTLQRGARWLEDEEYVEFWRLVIFEGWGRFRLMRRYEMSENKVRYILSRGPKDPVPEEWIQRHREMFHGEAKMTQ